MVFLFTDWKSSVYGNLNNVYIDILSYYPNSKLIILYEVIILVISLLKSTILSKLLMNKYMVN